MEGRIVVGWVGVLERECGQSRLESRRQSRLDLTAVTFIEPAGVAVLLWLTGDGVAIIHVPDFIDARLRGDGGVSFATGLRKAEMRVSGVGNAAEQESYIAVNPLSVPPAIEDNDAASMVGAPGPGCSGEPRWDTDELGREALAYADSLYNLARYLTRNATAAEDLVQETYARALRAAAQFTPGSNLKAWLVRILRNTFISTYRRQRRNPTVGGLDTVNPIRHDPIQGEWLRGDAELHRLRTVVGGEIERALMSLSEDARTVVLLDLEGLTEQEVADVMSCPVGTVKSRLWRARAVLRHQLADYSRNRVVK